MTAVEIILQNVEMQIDDYNRQMIALQAKIGTLYSLKNYIKLQIDEERKTK